MHIYLNPYYRNSSTIGAKKIIYKKARLHISAFFSFFRINQAKSLKKAKTPQKQGLRLSFVHFSHPPPLSGQGLPLTPDSAILEPSFGEFIRVVDVAAVNDEGLHVLGPFRLMRVASMEFAAYLIISALGDVGENHAEAVEHHRALD